MAERTYIIGQSGTGKSTLLKTLILEDTEGFIFLDPHGDLATELADAGHCDIFWEPARTIIGFNPIKDISKSQRHLVASNITTSFKNVYGDSWGPRLEWILYNSVLLLTDNNANLTDIPRLLTDDFYRAKLLRKASAPDFWDREFDTWERRQRNEAIAPVLNKIGPLIINPILKQTLSHNTINLKRIMDRGQRLVVNLSKGELGEQASHLLGALLVSSIAHIAQNRATIPYDDRVPVTLYADEFQNFATDSFASILSEARKYKLSLCIAHQYLGQLSEQLRQAVFGNVSRIITFQISPEDAEMLLPVFDPHDPKLIPFDDARQSYCELGLHDISALTQRTPFTAWVKQGGEVYLEQTQYLNTATGRLAAIRRRTQARYGIKASLKHRRDLP